MFTVASLGSRIGNFGFAEEGDREHQLAPGARHEVWEVRARLQTDAQDAAPGKSEARHHRQQHSAAQVRTKNTRTNWQLESNLAKV